MLAGVARHSDAPFRLHLHAHIVLPDRNLYELAQQVLPEPVAIHSRRALHHECGLLGERLMFEKLRERCQSLRLGFQLKPFTEGGGQQLKITE